MDKIPFSSAIFHLPLFWAESELNIPSMVYLKNSIRSGATLGKMSMNLKEVHIKFLKQLTTKTIQNIPLCQKISF